MSNRIYRDYPCCNQKTDGVVCINSITQTVKSFGFKTRNNEFIQTIPSVTKYKNHTKKKIFTTQNIITRKNILTAPVIFLFCHVKMAKLTVRIEQIIKMVITTMFLIILYPFCITNGEVCINLILRVSNSQEFVCLIKKIYIVCPICITQNLLFFV